MSASFWFNARVLCCELEPFYSQQLRTQRARVSWAPLAQGQEGPEMRRLEGDWADPDFPYRAVEGHDWVLLRWPPGPSPPEWLRWWLSASLHLVESARRYRVRAMAVGLPSQAAPPNQAAGRFLEEYLKALGLPAFCAAPEAELIAHLEGLFRADGA